MTRLRAGNRLLPAIQRKCIDMKLRMSLSLALVVSLSSSQASTLFSSGFDTDLGFGSEASSPDHEVTFGYDYSADGIGAARMVLATVWLSTRRTLHSLAAIKRALTFTRTTLRMVPPSLSEAVLASL